MKRSKLLIIIILIFDMLLCGCTSSTASKEEPIYYPDWFSGEWESMEVLGYYYYHLRESEETADSLVGKIYDCPKTWQEMSIGGVIPIRDMNMQPFFFEGFPYSPCELGLSGNYYTIIQRDKNDYSGDPCFIVRNRDEMLVTESRTGIYTIKRKDSGSELQVNAYDFDLTFEDNIRSRMALQGIKYDSYYRGVWEGNWIIKEVIFSDHRKEAKKHIGEEVSYITAIDSFDLQFIDSNQDRIFYGMPTTGELELTGPYYVLIWDEDHEYPAAIVKSEHEIFLIKGNSIYRAVQEETYLSDTLLQGL